MKKLVFIAVVLFASCETVKQKEVHKIAEIFPNATYMDGSMLQMLGDHNYMVSPNGGDLTNSTTLYLFRFDVDGNLVDTVNENHDLKSSSTTKNKASTAKPKSVKKPSSTLEDKLRPTPVK